MKTQQYFTLIFDGVDVAINNKICSILRCKMLQWVAFECLSSDKIFGTAVNNNIMSVCVLAFVKLHPVRNFSAPYCQVCLAGPYHIPLRYLRIGTIFEKKYVCFVCPQLLYATFFNIRRIQRDIVILYIKRGLHVKYSLFLSKVNET